MPLTLSGELWTQKVPAGAFFFVTKRVFSLILMIFQDFDRFLKNFEDLGLKIFETGRLDPRIVTSASWDAFSVRNF